MGGGGGHMSGGWGGGGGRSMGSSGMMRSGNFAGSGMSSSRSNVGNLSATHNHQSFTKNNFANSGTKSNGAINHSVNRMNSGNLSHSGLNKNAFVRSHNIANGNMNHMHNNNMWNHNHFYPWFGFGGFGLWGLGFGYGFGWPYYAFGYGGYGYGGYGGYGYGYPCYGYNYYGYGDDPNANTYLVAQADASADPNLPANQGDAASAANFIDQGEVDFKAGRYQAAARDWQHALVDDPKNGGVMMLMAQTLFALGQYDDAAGATQAAMQMLPDDKWGVVITNYTQLYGNPIDYNNQLKALEKARDAKPDSPALHFLLGFHFGYLNYPKNAVKELDKTLTLAPKDLGARKLRDLFAAKWPEAPPLPPEAVQAAEEAAKAGQKGPGAKPGPSDGT